MKNALLPVLTILGPLFAVTLTGTLVVEQVFAIPGLGKYFISSIGNRDYPVVTGVYLLFGFLVIAMNTVVDILGDRTTTRSALFSRLSRRLRALSQQRKSRAETTDNCQPAQTSENQCQYWKLLRK